jgi:hypothetical protein
MKKNLFVGLCVSLFSASAFSNYVCSGAVNGVGIDPKSGAILVQSIGVLEWPKLCSVRAEINGTSVEACKVIYSTLLTAQTTQKSVTLWFNDGKDCSKVSHVPWETLTGWYFGPVINN